jgi:DNA-binding NtrC family response regulator
LFENELFGHVGGAFTGARPRSEGLVSEAEHGTLFLDEIDSLSLPCQVKLLRFIQEREYRRLGESRLRHADIRVIAASNADLHAVVRDGNFREDLFFRLRGFPVEVPPLSERRDDIPLLLEEYAARLSEILRLPRVVFSDAALRRLETYAWPGNVRELENCVKYLTCLQLTRPVDPYDLPLLGGARSVAAGRRASDDPERPFRDAKKHLVDDFERNYLGNALRRANGNIAQAALASGKPRRVFFELMRKHGITARDFVDRRSEEARWKERHPHITVLGR